MILYGDKDADRQMIASAEYDICVIGAGMVGILMANELKASGKKVIVVDSGIKNEADSQPVFWRRRFWDPIAGDLDRAVFAPGSWGEKVRSDYFKTSRTRGFGGSTSCWGGWIRPLDSSDFKQWPVNLESALTSFYPRALRYVGLEEESATHFDHPDWWKDKTTQPIAQMKSDVLTKIGLATVIIQQQADLNLIDFNEQFKDIFDGESNSLTLLKNATATYLKTKQINGSKPFSCGPLTCRYLIDSKTAGKEEITVKAKKYVLAMGGLEIPRFLMNCIPGSYGLTELLQLGLGSYYMGHPKYQTAANCFITPTVMPEVAETSFYGGTIPLKNGGAIQAYIVPVPNTMISEQIGNFRLVVSMNRSQSSPSIPNVNVEINFEQQPNKNSRIYLSEDKDPFGLKRLELDWRFVEKDSITVNTAMALAKKYLLAFDNINGTWNDSYCHWDWTKTQSPPFVGTNEPYTGDHHMGTCRIGATDSGVVNGDLQVTGFDNMWICSTGVYPTGGWANASFVLLAMALRLSDQLKQNNQENS